MVFDKGYSLIWFDLNQTIIKDGTQIVVCTSLACFKEIHMEADIDKVKAFFNLFEIVKVCILVWIPEFSENIEVLSIFLFDVTNEITHKEGVDMLDCI